MALIPQQSLGLVLVALGLALAAAEEDITFIALTLLHSEWPKLH